MTRMRCWCIRAVSTLSAFAFAALGGVLLGGAAFGDVDRLAIEHRGALACEIHGLRQRDKAVHGISGEVRLGKIEAQRAFLEHLAFQPVRLGHEQVAQVRHRQALDMAPGGSNGGRGVQGIWHKIRALPASCSITRRS